MPLNTFFTTNKKTYILALTKKIPLNVGGIPTLPKQISPVFTYLCSEIGETRDVYRFDIEQNDLEAASDLFNMFKGAKIKFRTDDPRCKIISIDKFYTSAHWAVDRWWTREEKIQLGVEDDVETITLSGLATLISDVSSSLMEYREPLYELEKKKTIISRQMVNIIDPAVFRLSSSGIGLNRVKLNALNTDNPDDFPVYTAGQEPVAFIKRLPKEPFGANVDNPVLSFATNGDGSAGRNFVIHTKPFYVNTDRIVVQVLRKDISPQYVRVALNDMKEKYGFNHAHKANSHNLAPVTIQLPVKSNGCYDLEQQEIMVEIFNYLEDMRKSLLHQKDRVVESNVCVDLSCYHFAQKKISDLFSVLRGSGKYTRSYTQEHPGAVPLFSGNTSGAFAYVDTADYNTPCLSWVIDGLAGYLMFHSSEFSATNHRGVLLPKFSDINLQYAKFIMEPIFRNAKKGRVGDNGENEYSSLPPFMVSELLVPFPVDDTGKISLSAQQEIAEQYITVEQCKRDVAEKLDALAHQKIEL